MDNQPVKFDPKSPFDQAQGRHHRKSIRLAGYDYAQAGAYFVTSITWRRGNLFGEVVNGEMVLNDFGKIADDCWRAIPEHFPTVELGAHVVMPNHVHGIIMIVDNQLDAAGRGAIYRAPTTDHAHIAEHTPTVEQFGKPTVGSIPTIVRTYKAAVTRLIGRQFNATGIWQRNYYEHILRNKREMAQIWDYIEANPANWLTDDENPVNIQKETP